MAKLYELEVSTIDQLKAARIRFLAASLEAEIHAMVASNMTRHASGDSPAHVDEFYHVLDAYKKKAEALLEEQADGSEASRVKYQDATSDLASCSVQEADCSWGQIKKHTEL